MSNPFFFFFFFSPGQSQRGTTGFFSLVMRIHGDKRKRGDGKKDNPGKPTKRRETKGNKKLHFLSPKTKVIISQRPLLDVFSVTIGIAVSLPWQLFTFAAVVWGDGPSGRRWKRIQR